MALRNISKRFAALPLGVEKGFLASPMQQMKGFVGFRTFFKEKYFWYQGNTGPFFLLLLFSPFIYRGFKSWYWTRQMAVLNRQEIVADRYEWLHQTSIKDELDRSLAAKADQYQPLMLGPDRPETR